MSASRRPQIVTVEWVRRCQICAAKVLRCAACRKFAKPQPSKRAA